MPLKIFQPELAFGVLDPIVLIVRQFSYSTRPFVNHCARLIFTFLVFFAVIVSCAAQSDFRDQLKRSSFKIAYESYVDNNWEIFVINADGSGAVNVTHTPDLQEHYPQISPDGTKICFSADEGEGRDAVRSIWIMDTDGKHRKKLVDHAREQFWRPDG